MIIMLFKKNNDMDDGYLPDPGLTVLPEVPVSSLSDKVSIDLGENGESDMAPEFPVSDSVEPLIITGTADEALVSENKQSVSFDDNEFNFSIDPDSIAAANAYREEADLSLRVQADPDGDALTRSSDNVSEKNDAEKSADETDNNSTADAGMLSENDSDMPEGVPEVANDPSVGEEDGTADGIAEEVSEDAAEELAENDVQELNDFELSIKNFKAEDADPALKTEKKGFDIVRFLAIVICAGVFAVSTYTLVTNIADKIKSDRIYSDIIDSVADGFNVDGGLLTNGGKITLLAQDDKTAYTPTMDEIIKNGVGQETTPSKYTAELAKMRASLESLKNINPDIYGWIKVPGTNINYPIAQTDNNEYYLDHAYTGDNLVNGSIYADYRCHHSVRRNYNTVLYGHNITSGSMFHHVVEFFKPEVFNNTLIYLYTFEGIFIYEPFSIHEAAYDSGYVNMGFDTGDDFVKFASNLASLSDVKTDREFTEDDRIITLSTCTNGISTQRYALHGVLVEVIVE